MNKKSLWFIYILISILLYSCGGETSPEPNNISVTATKKPTSTLTGNSSATKAIQADVEFNLSSINKVPPDDILTEISYFGGGGGGICVEISKPTAVNQIDTELMISENLFVCGWKKNETVTITTYYPDGRTTTQKMSATEEDGGSYYIPLKIKFGVDDPEGEYNFAFEGISGKVNASAIIRKPNGIRLFRIDDSHLLLYGFKPSESVNLYYYYGNEFVGWETYQVDVKGQLTITVPAYNKGQFFFAIGEKSGETLLLTETLFGPRKLVFQDSIIWSPCGEFKTRLTINRQARVAYADGTDMRIRKKPGFNGKVIDSVPEGTEITINDGPKCLDNVTWWKISGGRNYKEGWMAEYNDKTYWLEPTPSQDTPVSSPTSTPTAAAPNSINTFLSKNIIFIDAPSTVVEGLANLDILYVFYARKDIPVSKFNDINEIEIFVALNNIPNNNSADEVLNILTDGGRITITPVFQNNLKVYGNQLMKKNRIGLMVPSVAEYYGFNQRDDVVQIIFR